MKKSILSILLASIFLLVTGGLVYASDYYFSLDKEVIDVYWEANSSIVLDYQMTFTNQPGAKPIDFVDIGMPGTVFDLASATATLNGNPLTHIAYSSAISQGIEVGVNPPIPAGKSGIVAFHIGSVSMDLYEDDNDPNYASAVFANSSFGSQYVTGTTDLTVRFHLPPGIQANEPRYHQISWSGNAEPLTDMDSNGRVTYTWQNKQANGYTQYTFGASFPKKYVPNVSLLTKPAFFAQVGAFISDFFDTFFSNSTCCFGGCFALIFIGGPILSAAGNRNRKLQYLPPSIKIEGHGIKRGLTAVEAAVLMEQPMDKILTMLLFSSIKKGAATVITKDPLKLQFTDPPPSNLYDYETAFLNAFKDPNAKIQRPQLQTMMVNLVKSVSEKMKGFSGRESTAYYESIIIQAWQQVEAANTPDVKMQKYDEVMDWTMLDKNYENRTRTTFGSGPIFVPMWWGHYDPSYHSASSIPVSTPSMPSSGGGGGRVLPTLPGADFAASIVGGVQSMASGVVGNVGDFTSGVTNKTNPVPVSTSSRSSFGGGGGHSCACACACAGCACACAGGGR